VYKSANVYNSITDFAMFADDTIKTIEACQRQEVSADPNQTVQAFIDLCQRHEGNFYKFVHEVHKHDNGLFDQLMGWLEDILEFLRHGPAGGGKLDMNALFQGATDSNTIDGKKAIREINSLIKWQTARKKWHQDKTRQKMASAGDEPDAVVGGMAGFKSSDFGLNEVCFIIGAVTMAPLYPFEDKTLTISSSICKTSNSTTMAVIRTLRTSSKTKTLTTLSKLSARTGRGRRRS
jgi:hypothetical protein